MLLILFQKQLLRLRKSIMFSIKKKKLLEFI